MLKKLRLLTVELGLARTCVTVSSSVEGLVLDKNNGNTVGSDSGINSVERLEGARSCGCPVVA